MSAPDRRAMVERPGKDLSMRRRCALVGVARSGVYRPKPVAGADDLAVMRRIDELHLELPFYGSRRMTFELNKQGRGVNRKRVRRLMRVMGIEALVPRPGTSKAAPGHKIYPYLLRGLKIVEPNHVWADGRGRFMDNIFIERLWRSIKYEEVHLKAYADGREARAGIGSWMTFYNFRRPHQAMNNQMPMAVWRAGIDKIEAAARAVDMPLRLDNANALPTYPQQKQQEAD